MAITLAMLGAAMPAAAQAVPPSKPHSVVREEGFVADSSTALRIAEAVLLEVYGADTIEKQKPLMAKLNGDVWTIVGRLPQGRAGGVAVIELSKMDGRILRVSHSR